MTTRWHIHRHDNSAVGRLSSTAQISPIIAQLLLGRGIEDVEASRRFLEPKLNDLRAPELLPGCSKAVDLLYDAVQSGKRIAVHGDYDVDGMTGTAILVGCLRMLDVDAQYVIPCRFNEGYGLSEETLRRLALDSDGQRTADMVVTVDCGISSVEEAKLARELGLSLIITDHHEPGDQLPDADAIVHPRLPGTDYPMGGLSGSCVALKVAWGLLQKASGTKRVRPAMRDYLLRAVGMAAMGTVADVVPLLDENRVLVTHGLRCILENPSPGLNALMRVAGLTDKSALSAEDIGFQLSPRLNAVGRLEQARLGVELLLTDREDRAEELAQYIDQLNETRKTLQRRIERAAKQQAEANHSDDDPALVLADQGWNQGIIGIVAGKLAESFKKPVVIISLDESGLQPGVGSARSIPGVNLHEALGECSDLLERHGGHAAAAGLAVRTKNLDAFRTAFCEAVTRQMENGNGGTPLPIDAEIPLAGLSLETVRHIEQLGPFGEGNPRPIFCTGGIELTDPPRTMGKGDLHLLIPLRQGNINKRAVAFFKASDWLADLTAHTDRPIRIAFRAEINHFRGQQSVQLHLVDWQPETDGDA